MTANTGIAADNGRDGSAGRAGKAGGNINGHAGANAKGRAFRTPYLSIGNHSTISLGDVSAGAGTDVLALAGLGGSAGGAGKAGGKASTAFNKLQNRTQKYRRFRRRDTT